MGKIIWKLTAGRGANQETPEEKRRAGNDYIARLKSDGVKILKVEDKEDYLLITTEDV